jgi:mRNA-degrading endonuclease RelE of RelBE toxin-antitoxin system
MPWKIRREKKFSKYLKGLGNTVRENLYTTINDLENAEDPRKLGIPQKQTKKHGICYVIHLTSSYALAYRVSIRERIVELVVVGDHKLLYGKD